MNDQETEYGQLRRIADALEEILRLVKKDLETSDAYRRQQND